MIPLLMSGGRRSRNLGLRYLGSATGTSGISSGNVFSGGLADAPRSGDIIICSVMGAGGVTAPTGFTLIDNDGSAERFFYKVLTGSWGGFSESGYLASAAHAWRGVDTATPLDVATPTMVSTTSLTADPPSITPVTSGAKVIAMIAGRNNNNSFSVSGWSGMDNITTVVNESGGGDFYGAGISSYDWTSGAFDPGSWTVPAYTADSDNSSAVTIALRPAT